MKLSQDIAAVLSEKASFWSFAVALRSAGMIENLSSRGPYTVFAPSNEAFQRLPGDAFHYLMGDKLKLKHVLSFHVASGHMLVKNLRHGDLSMLQGGTAQVRISGGSVEINGARVLGAESLATNGVVHRIDALLLPRGVTLLPNAA
jgi:uncharacterized surface protein with fasciclin (FAS1) repeats